MYFFSHYRVGMYILTHFRLSAFVRERRLLNDGCKSNVNNCPGRAEGPSKTPKKIFFSFPLVSSEFAACHALVKYTKNLRHRLRPRSDTPDPYSYCRGKNEK